MHEYDEIVKDIVDFWGSDRTLHSHHPYLIYEFGDTAFVIKEQGQVIAYLFGGQGTINTPSWSPDSKRIAFVSNSGILNK